jgi:hypothetical protein
MLCSFASFDCRALEDLVVSTGAERLGGYGHIKYLSHISRCIRNLPLFPARSSLPDSLFVHDATLVQLQQGTFSLSCRRGCGCREANHGQITNTLLIEALTVHNDRTVFLSRLHNSQGVRKYGSASLPYRYISVYPSTIRRFVIF